MKQQHYNKIIASYKERQKKRLLYSAAAMILGLLLFATGIGFIIFIAAMIYFVVEAIRTSTLSQFRNKSLKKLQQQGVLDHIMDSLQHATTMQVDGVTYAWTDKYLCLPHGVILPLADIAWIFPFVKSLRYMMIPVAKLHWCKIHLLDGSETLAFYGKVKDKQAFNALLVGLKGVIPHLLIGYTPENQKLYHAMTAKKEK